MLGSVISGLNLIDLFGRPVTISFFGKEKFKSGFGGICTLLFLGFLAWALYNGSKDFFRGENPQIINSETFLDDPREMFISKETFPIGVGIQAPLSMNMMPFIDESIYTVDFVHVTMNRTVYGNGTTSEKFTEVALEKELCTPSHFGELAESFAILSLSTAYCLKEKQPALEEVRIQGVYMSLFYEYLLVRVTQCNNDTSAVTCSTPEVINEYLSGSFFNVLYVNTAINPNNFTRPDAKYRNVFSVMISPANYLQATFQLGHADVTTDAGWIIPENKAMNLTKVNEIYQSLQFDPNPDGILMACTFEVSRLENHCQRTYKKIQDVLAEVGGLANVGLMAILIVITPFLNLKLRESLVNELFDIYPLPPKKKKNNKKRKNKQGESCASTNIHIENTTEVHKGFNRGSLFEHHEAKIDIIASADHSYQPFAPRSPLLSPEFVSRAQSPNSSYHAIKTGKKSSSLNLSPSAKNFSKKAIEEDDIPSIENTEMKKKGKYPSLMGLMSPKGKSWSDFDSDAQTPQFSKGTYNKKVINLQLERLKKKKDVRKTLSPSNLQHKLNKLHEKIVEETNPGNNDSEYPSLISEGPLSNHHLVNNVDTHRRIILEPESLKVEEDLEKRDIPDHSLKHWAPEPQSPTTKEDIPVSEKPQRINLTIWEYITSFFYKSERLKQKMDILNEGIAKIDARLDVINIMKKLREIDKLKATLLEFDQLILFNNLPKPQIKPKGLRRSKQIAATHHSLIRKATFIEQNYTPSKILDAQDQIEKKQIKNEIDRKLISFYTGKVE